MRLNVPLMSELCHRANNGDVGLESIHDRDCVCACALCWLLEQSIPNQLSLFHLNRLSSPMVLQFDMDLAKTTFDCNHRS